MRRQDLLDVSAAADKAALHARLVGVAQSLGFPFLSATLVIEQPGAPAVMVSVNETPQAYADIQNDVSKGRRDPVLHKLKTASVPIVYDQSFYAAAGEGGLWEEQAPFGYRNGVAMALHLPGGRHFLLGVDRHERLPSNDRAMTRLMADLQLLAVHTQEAALRVLLDEALAVGEIPSLTTRELEVLRWTMVGKDAWSVAQVLEVTESTVNFHLRNAERKLCVAGKHQAVLRAMALGLL
ncbi:LuxR C-terminal-related transcriptional regulator [Rubrivivax albus]|uniref:LuxR family transcriptional regulator n=1 Tax=Rubrivivax albus TaxID=2499835 RepID=A0A3S2X2J2_9BURK|nr:LuxR C-terminal-related transcriptional regulator [Rubrivivax albus]RVT52633.1 LuxR family transcriptional regulator [Rubrivivax albus]